MVQRTRLIECPGCGKQLEDTKQDKITCKYCGTVFVREEVVQEDEEYIRRKMIVELKTNMEIYKRWKTVSIVFMIVSFVLPVPFLFSVPVSTLNTIMAILFFAGGIIFFILMMVFDRKYDSSKSKASDISMRRRL